MYGASNFVAQPTSEGSFIRSATACFVLLRTCAHYHVPLFLPFPPFTTFDTHVLSNDEPLCYCSDPRFLIQTRFLIQKHIVVFIKLFMPCMYVMMIVDSMRIHNLCREEG